MLYLTERQVGFDSDTLGFPSIDGCHAVVLQTNSGMYGFHNLGGSIEIDRFGNNVWKERSKAFADFVRNHHLLAQSKKVHMYSVCFRTKRCYQGANAELWKDEMKSFAKGLGYKGAISGYNLDKVAYPRSAYVEARKVGQSVYLFCKPWHEMNSSTGPQRDKVNYMATKEGKAVEITDSAVTTSVTKASGADLHRIQDADLDTTRR